MVAWLGPLISAGANIIGGIMGKNAAKGQMKEQERYAKNAIQWKVADAKAAGIHPLYALGAQTMSYSPVSVGGEQAAMQSAGQDIGRAVHAAATEGDRTLAKASATLQLENQGLQNEMLKSQIARLRQAPNPPMPGTGYVVPGQTQSGPTDAAIKEEAKRKNFDPSNPSGEVFGVSDVGYSHTGTGGFFPMPSDEVKQRIEDNKWQEFMHFFRNNIMPSVSTRYQNPPKGGAAPEGTAWVYDPVNGYMLYDYVNKRYLSKSHQ